MIPRFRVTKKNIYYSTPLEAILENIRVPQIAICCDVISEKAYIKIRRFTNHYLQETFKQWNKLKV